MLIGNSQIKHVFDWSHIFALYFTNDKEKCQIKMNFVSADK